MYLNIHLCILPVRAAVVRHHKYLSYPEYGYLVSGAHRRLVSTFRRVDVSDHQTARLTIYGHKGRRESKTPPLLVGLQ